jgi:hypothetical protein
VSDTTTDFFDNIGGGAGAPTANLKGVGDFVHGEVLEMFKRDYVPFGKTEPEKNQDGSTRQQLVIILQTELRNWQGVVKVPLKDHTDPNQGFKDPSEDDGKRAVYAPERSNIQFAIGRAVQAAAARFEVGGSLGVKIENLKDTGKGNPLKEHAAVYKAKPAATGDEFFGGAAAAPASTPAPVAQEQAQAPAPAAAPAAAPAPAAAAPTQDPWATSAPAAGSQPPF